MRCSPIKCMSLFCFCRKTLHSSLNSSMMNLALGWTQRVFHLSMTSLLLSLIHTQTILFHLKTFFIIIWWIAVGKFFFFFLNMSIVALLCRWSACDLRVFPALTYYDNEEGYLLNRLWVCILSFKPQKKVLLIYQPNFSDFKKQSKYTQLWFQCYEWWKQNSLLLWSVLVDNSCKSRLLSPVLLETQLSLF